MLNEESFDEELARKHAHELLCDFKSIVSDWVVLNKNDENLKEYAASIIISAIANHLTQALLTLKNSGSANKEVKEIFANICDNIMQEISKEENKND
jgi:hypothetical protein